MQIGLCDRMPEGWFEEFKRSADALGHACRTIRIGRNDWVDQIKGLDLFIWRLVMSDTSAREEANTKIPVIEAMGATCFPSRRMLWLYDDKIRETYFLEHHHYPVPRTWIFFDKASAQEFLADAAYPMIVKSHCGASASGVMLLRSRREAEKLVDGSFRETTLWDKILENYYYLPQLAKGNLGLQLRARYRNSWPEYVYFQEFIRTDKDWRITTFGEDLVSVFMRKNRPDDFRASGSGIWERVAEEDVPVEACDLALRISNAHDFTCMTYDFMDRDGQWVIGEISYTLLLNPVYTETLFRREGSVYRRVDPIPVGTMHLQAMQRVHEASRRGGASFFGGV